MAQPKLVSRTTLYCSTVLWNLREVLRQSIRLCTGCPLSATSSLCHQLVNRCSSHPVLKILDDLNESGDDNRRESDDLFSTTSTSSHGCLDFRNNRTCSMSYFQVLEGALLHPVQQPEDLNGFYTRYRAGGQLGNRRGRDRQTVMSHCCSSRPSTLNT